LSMGLYF